MNRRNAFFLLLFSILTLLLTYPLALQMADHVPGTATWSMDEYGYVWNNWWFKHAVLDLNSSPFASQYLFYPLGTSLVLYAYTLLHVMLALPLQLAFGLIPATNFTVLFSFATAGFGMYLFVSYLLRVSLRAWSEKYGERLGERAATPLLLSLAAFVAGVAFAFTSSRFVYVSLGHYNIVASEWLPFYLLFLFKTLLVPGRKSPLLAGLFAAFALYTETTDGVLLFLLTAVILVFEWRLLNRLTLTRLALVGASAVVLFAPLLIPTINELFFSGYSLPGWGHSEKLLVDLNGFFTPTSLHPLNRFWESELDHVRQGIARFSDVNTFFVGYATAALALVGFARFARRNRLWLAVALIFGVLALGPFLHINGRSEFDLDGLTTTIPLPFLALHYIPIIRENRVPNRYSILVTIGLAVLIAYGAWWLMTRLASLLRARNADERPIQWAAGLCAALISAALLSEHLALPLPLTDARVPAVYEQIADDSGDFTVLSVPLGWRNSFGQVGAEDTRTQYYQSVSEKYLLTGQIQRNPPFLFNYFQRDPILSSIIQLETYKDVPPERIAADKKAAGEFVYFFDIRYLVVNAPVPGRVPYSDTHDRVLDYLRQVLPLGEQVSSENGTLAFRIQQPAPPDHLEIHLGTDAAQFYRGDGWSDAGPVGGETAAWAMQQNARLFVPLRSSPTPYLLTVRALPFEYAGHTQTLALAANGRQVERQVMKPGWSEYVFRLAPGSLHEGLNELSWSFDYVVRPSDALPPDYSIGQTGLRSPVDIAVQSTGEFGSIKIGGKEVSPLKRGYNLAVIDPASGAVLEVRNFDTGGESIVESRGLTDFIRRLPQGAIIAGAVQEEAATMLREGSAGALVSLGLTDLRGTMGKTQAFIVVKGKPGGLEVTGDGASALSVGHNLDTRPLGAAFDWLRVDRANGQ